MNTHHLDFRKEDSAGVVPPLPSEKYSTVKIVLASNSPRRRELLGMIVPHFELAESRDIDESYPSTLDAHLVPEFLSKLKADAYSADLESGELLITADTVVISRGKILGKPKNVDDARRMLNDLRNATHTVVTGVTLRSLEQSTSFSESTEVTFGNLTDEEIDNYITLYRPFDKAGAYGIQEWIGGAAISGIKGCFYNVMGLPLHALFEHLKTFKGI